MKIYFASDLHLIEGDEASRQREYLFIQWLDKVKNDATEVFLLGDMFDFWFEYKKTVPRGFSRFLGKLCELTDSGIPVHYFTGNHDLWVNDYLISETGVTVYREPLEKELNGVRFMIGHGHGLGDSKAYNMLLRVFNSTILRPFYAAMHPRWGINFGQWWSAKSFVKRLTPKSCTSIESEHLVQYARQTLRYKHIDYFVFGHRHLPMHVTLSTESHYVNTGEWVQAYSYAVFDGSGVSLKYFTDVSHH